MATAVAKNAPRKRSTKRLRALVAKAPLLNSPASSQWGALFNEHYPGGGGAQTEVERLVPLLKAVIALSKKKEKKRKEKKD